MAATRLVAKGTVSVEGGAATGMAPWIIPGWVSAASGTVAVTGITACAAGPAVAVTRLVAGGVVPGDGETVTGMALWFTAGWVSAVGGTGTAACAVGPTGKGEGMPKFTGDPISVVS